MARTTLALMLLAGIAVADKFIRDDATGGDGHLIGVWDQPTKTLTLTMGVNEPIIIADSGITLDGAGHTVTAVGGAFGINISRARQDVTIRNCRVTGAATGIRVYQDCTGTRIEDNVVTANTRVGLYLSSGCHDTGIRGNEVTDHVASDNNATALRVDYSDRVQVIGNLVTRNNFGIFIYHGNSYLVKDNDCSGNPGPTGASATGIQMYADASVVENNFANDGGGGIRVSGSDNRIVGNEANRNYYGGIGTSGDRNVVEGNTASGNSAGIDGYVGVSVYYGDGCVVRNNRADGNWHGLYFTALTNAVIENNTASGNGFIGLYLQHGGARDVILRNNTSNGNQEGYRLTAFDYEFTGNRADDNTGYGLWLDGEPTLCEGNRFDGNGWGITVTASPTVVRANELSGNGGGLFVGTDGHTIEANTVAGSGADGIRLGGNGCAATDNTVSDSGTHGIYLAGTAANNTVRRNTVTGSGTAGIRLATTLGGGNLIYDNVFNNAANVIPGGVANIWNVPAAPGPNIVGGPSIGGNYWATPAGTGWSETCTDADGDGFCDEPFVMDANNIDDLPLVLNTPPSCNPSGAGVYELGSTITLGGTVADNEGDLLTYQWREGAAVLSSGTMQAAPGGGPVALPDFSPVLGLGVHALQLVVDDGHILEPVACDVIVEVIDTTDPIVHPESDCSMLWPPNHQLVSCTIHANASDNDGLPPHLDVTVGSNEPDDGLGDGDTPNDIQNLTVDQTTGTITVDLRAERGGVGSGRVYTVTITATDGEGNSSMTSLTILVPRSKGQGGN